MRAKEADQKLFHDPYRWSSGARKADRILDTPGPKVATHTASLSS